MVCSQKIAQPVPVFVEDVKPPHALVQDVSFYGVPFFKPLMAMPPKPGFLKDYYM